MDGVLQQVGRARVKTTFRLTGRGHVLVLTDQDGILPLDGIIWNGSASVPYVGPNVADASNGEAFVTIIVDDADFSAVRDAHTVTFSAGAEAAIPD